ncbi:MAG: hypothetical protein V1913_14355 [Fibrobacterota bacterium]
MSRFIQLLGIVGSLLLSLGVFSPIAKAPFKGTVTLLRADREFAAYILVFAAVAFVLSLRKRCAWLVVPGVSALAVLAAAMFNFYRQLTEATRGFRGIGHGALEHSVQNAVLDSVQWRWGGILLAGGIALILAAGIAASTHPPLPPLSPLDSARGSREGGLFQSKK